MKSSPLISVLLLPIALGACSGNDTNAYTSWRIYGGDNAGTKYSQLEQINVTNVENLSVAWVFRTDDVPVGNQTTLQNNPIVVDGVMYLTSASRQVIAIDAATGEKRWAFNPFKGEKSYGVSRGVSYWEDADDKRILYAVGSYLYAIDAVSGAPIKEFGTDGKVDIRKGLDRDDLPLLYVANTSPGIVYKDLLILGSVVPDAPGPVAPGHVRAYNVRTGEREWIFHTIPHPGEPGYDTWPEDAWRTVGGANVWSGFTLDEKRGWVFFGTGSPSYDHYGGNREGTNLFGNSIVSLNAENGELNWYFQTVHHDLWDYDIPNPPNLVAIEQDGEEIEAVAQTTKMGHMFLLNRETGKPVFSVEERAVPKSELPGEYSWPTQPYPTKPAAYAKQEFTESDITDVSPEAHAAIREDFLRMGPSTLFDPPGFADAIYMPQFNGGTDWGGAAFDPASDTLFVNASNEAEWMAMESSVPTGQVSINALGLHVFKTLCSGCHGAERRLEDGPIAPLSLESVKSRMTRASVLSLLETGQQQMPSFTSLSDTEKRAVTAFLFEDGHDEQVSDPSQVVSWAEDTPYVGSGHHDWRDPSGFPANKPPWGTLSAIDLAAGEIRWQVPLGTYPELEAQGLPPTGTFNMGGPIVTAGGLIFIGAAMDERFHAYDKQTGELLWSHQMDAGGYATPSTYELDGKQYVVIAAGGGGKPGTRSGNAYYAFALSDD